MNAPRRKQPAPAQSPLRALTLFETLPPGHKTFRVPDDGSSPHLKEREYAVIDTTDREPQHGELFLKASSLGRRSRSIVQVRAGMCQISRTEITGTEPETNVWWLSDLAGFRQIDDMEGIPIFAGMTSGPYDAAEQYLQTQFIGRVVGYAANSFGHLIAPEAGWENEEEGNAAFDPVEYLDVVIGIGYQPVVFQRRDGSMGLQEWYGENPLTEAQHAAYMAVRTKYRAASKAHDRVVAECLRRGLVD
jgi:hypothetical protein